MVSFEVNGALVAPYPLLYVVEHLLAHGSYFWRLIFLILFGFICFLLLLLQILQMLV